MKDNFGCVKTFATLCLEHKKYNKQELAELTGFDLKCSPIFGKRINKNVLLLSSIKEVNSKNLTDHIQYLIDEYFILIQKTDVFSQIRLYAYWESLNGNGGPYLEEKQMQILGNADIDLYLEFH